MFASSSTCGFYDPEVSQVIPADAVEISKALHEELLAGQSAGKMINFATTPPSLKTRPIVFQTAEQLVDKLDIEVAAIYAEWERFQSEYTLRESAALAYKAAGYTGEVSIWISAFATASNLSVRDACDMILSQAEALRVAKEKIGALRMRKYEILALSEQAALDKYNEIYAQIQEAVVLIT